MERKVFPLGSFMTAVCLLSLPSLAHTAPLNSKPVAPTPSTPTPRISNPSELWTIRYIAFIAHPKTPFFDAKRLNFPAVILGMNSQSQLAMTSTPTDFVKAFQAQQPDHDIRIVLTGSELLQSGVAGLVEAGPASMDPLGMSLSDRITVRQNGPTTLDIVSKGSYLSRPVRGESGCKTSWDGENDQFAIGRSYTLGADRRANGDIMTWAFCILPGNIDQVASIWKQLSVTKDQMLVARSDRRVK